MPPLLSVTTAVKSWPSSSSPPKATKFSNVRPLRSEPSTTSTPANSASGERAPAAVDAEGLADQQRGAAEGAGLDRRVGRRLDVEGHRVERGDHDLGLVGGEVDLDAGGLDDGGLGRVDPVGDHQHGGLVVVPGGGAGEHLVGCGARDQPGRQQAIDVVVGVGHAARRADRDLVAGGAGGGRDHQVLVDADAAVAPMATGATRPVTAARRTRRVRRRMGTASWTNGSSGAAAPLRPH